MSVYRVGDAVLGLVCMVLLLVLKLMRDHVPPVHPEMPPGVRLSHGLVWTATTGEGCPAHGGGDPPVSGLGVTWAPGYKTRRVALIGRKGEHLFVARDVNQG